MFKTTFFIIIIYIIDISNGIQDEPIFAKYLSPLDRREGFIFRDNNIAILYGGTDASARSLNDIYILDLLTLQWNTITTTGILPINSADPCVTYIKSKKQLFVTGGVYDNFKYVQDVYILDMYTWIWSKAPINITETPNGRREAVCLDDNDGNMIMYGGTGLGSVPLKITWLLNTTSWKWSNIGTLDKTIISASAIIYNNTIISYGGASAISGDEFDGVNFVRVYNMTNQTWSVQTTYNGGTGILGNSINNINGAQTFLINDYMYVIGGGSSSGTLTPPFAVRVLNLKNFTWLSNIDNSVARTQTHCIHYETHIYCWAGAHGSTIDPQKLPWAAYDILNNKWKDDLSITTGNAPVVRFVQGISWKNYVVIFGGKDIEYATNRTFLYDVRLNHWKEIYPISEIGEILPLYAHQLIRYNHQLISIGGQTKFPNTAISEISNTYVMDLNTFTFKNIPIKGPKYKVMSHTCAYADQTKAIFCYGGQNSTMFVHEYSILRKLDLSNPNEYVWTQISFTGVDPGGITFGQSAIYNNIMFINFGRGPLKDQEYSYEIDLSTYEITSTKYIDVSPRTYTQSTRIGTHLIFFGSQSVAGSTSNPLEIYDLQTKYWTSSIGYDGKGGASVHGSFVLVGTIIIFTGGTNYDNIQQPITTNQTSILYPGLFATKVDSINGDDLNCLGLTTSCKTLSFAIKLFNSFKPSTAIQAFLNYRIFVDVDGDHTLTKTVIINNPMTIAANSKSNIYCKLILDKICVQIQISDGQKIIKAVFFRNIRFIALNYIEQQGISLSGSYVITNDCEFNDFSASSVSMIQSNGTFIKTIFYNNTNRNNNGLGGGIYTYISSINIGECISSRNNAGNGGFIYALFSTIRIENNTKINDNTAISQGGSIASIYSNIYIYNSIITNNQIVDILTLPSLALSFKLFGKRNGGAIFASDSEVTLTNVTLTKNQAIEGGALWLSESKLYINNSTLSKNLATIQGGAITVDEMDEVIITNTKFISNSAQYLHGGAIFANDAIVKIIDNTEIKNNIAHNGGGGGIFFTNKLPIILDSSYVINNIALFGNELSSPPTYVKVLSSPKTLQTSGATVTEKILVVITDIFNNTIRSDNHSFVSIQSDMKAHQFFGESLVQPIKGEAIFDDVSIQFEPGQSIEIYFTIESPINDEKIISNKVITNIRSCDKNERRTTLGQVGICEKVVCGIGQYLVNEKCFNCPTGTKCSGDSVVLALNGYWLYENEQGFVDSVACNFQRCVDASLCIKNNNEQNIESKFLGCCNENRVEAVNNPLCGKCKYGFVEWGTKCIECSSYNGGLIFLFIVVSLLTLGLFHLAAQSTSGVTKIFFYHVQMLVVFFASSNTNWIRWLDIFNFNLLGASKVNICVAPLSPSQQLVLGIIIPFIVCGELLLIFCVHLLYWWLKYHRTCPINAGKSHKFHKSPYIRTLLGLFIFSYNSVSTSVFAYFRCVDVGTESVTGEYPGLSCNSTTYKRLAPLMYSVLILVIIVTPIFTIVSLRITFLYSATIRKKKRKMLERFGILYECYNPKFWFWEMIILARRTILIVIGVVLVNDRRSLYMFMSIVNILVLLSHNLANPYRFPFENYLESISLTLLTIVTMILAHSNGVPFGPTENILILLVVYIPLSFFVLLLLHLYFTRGAKTIKQLLERTKSRSKNISAGTRRPSVLELSTMSQHSSNPATYDYTNTTL